jgi:hypothetical protein
MKENEYEPIGSLRRTQTPGKFEGQMAIITSLFALAMIVLTNDQFIGRSGLVLLGISWCWIWISEWIKPFDNTHPFALSKIRKDDR